MNYENFNQKLNNIKFQKKNDNRYKLSGSEFDAQLLISNYLKGENTNNIFERFENDDFIIWDTVKEMGIQLVGYNSFNDFSILNGNNF